MADVVTLAVLVVLAVLSQFNLCPSHPRAFVVVCVVDLVVLSAVDVDFLLLGPLFYAHDGCLPAPGACCPRF